MPTRRSLIHQLIRDVSMTFATSGPELRTLGATSQTTSRSLIKDLYYRLKGRRNTFAGGESLAFLAPSSGTPLRWCAPLALPSAVNQYGQMPLPI